MTEDNSVIPLAEARRRDRARRRTPAPLLVTEDSAALEFARRYRGAFLYCHGHGSWFAWDGARWERDQTALVYERARQLARELTGEPADSKKPPVTSRTTFVSGVEKFCRSDRTFAVTADEWDRDPFLLGTPDGTVDLRTGVLREPDPDDRITKVTACAPVEEAACPLWIDFLIDATNGDQSLIDFIQQWCGYCLTGDVREHSLVFAHGSGGNGKSVWLNTVTSIMGDYAETAAMDTFTASAGDRHPTDLAMLRGARLVTASETEEGRAWAEARIKQMTGGDRITARFMRQDFFTFRPAFKLTVIGNHKPVLHVVDDAARRRFNIVPFIHKPPSPDRELETKLRREWPAILRWMINGCLDWQERGLVRPAALVNATAAYFSDQDLLGQWLEDEADAEIGNAFKTETVADLFQSWEMFCKRSGENAGSKKSFCQALEQRGFEKKRTNAAMIFRGLRLRPREPFGGPEQ